MRRGTAQLDRVRKSCGTQNIAKATRSTRGFAAHKWLPLMAETSIASTSKLPNRRPGRAQSTRLALRLSYFASLDVCLMLTAGTTFPVPGRSRLATVAAPAGCECSAIWIPRQNLGESSWSLSQQHFLDPLHDQDVLRPPDRVFVDGSMFAEQLVLLG